MIVSTVQLRKLVADDGMTLTDGDSYGKTIYLGVNDSRCTGGRRGSGR